MLPIGTRAHALAIDAPFSPRLKSRLERAVTHAIQSPSRALPTLRRAIIAATEELRRNEFTDEAIRALFARIIEDVARARALDTRSIVSGQPRWMDLTVKVLVWTETASPGD